MSQQNDEVVTRFPVSIEMLAHFQCPKCEGWWSIGDKPADRHWWYCPWCGDRNCFEVKRSDGDDNEGEH